MNYEKLFEFHRDDEDETDLHRAVRTKDVDIVKMTLANGGDILVNILNRVSRSPVHVAIEEELESIVQLLLSTVKDSMIEDQCYIHFAIAKGNINIVKLLAKHFSVLTKNQVNMTAFCKAINEDKFEILDYLLSLPSSRNTNSNIYEYSALFYVAIIAGNIEIVKTYFSSKFPINTSLQSNADDGWEVLNQHSGFSPLHLAVKFLRLNIVELLLDQGADVMKPNGAGSSALQIAFETKTRGIWKTDQDIEINDQIIDRLLNDILKKEALILTNSNRMSVIYAACSRDRPEVIEKCLQKKYITVEHLKKCDNQGSTPLHYAINNKCPMVAKMLLQHNVNVDQRDDEYCTPLYIATKEKSVKCIQILMQYKADPNLKDFHGNTPIHLAFSTRNYAILDLLLTDETLVNPNVTDPAGISHFHIACTRNNVDLVRTFIDAGTPVDLQVPIDLAIEYPVLRRKKDLEWRDYEPLDFDDLPIESQVPFDSRIQFQKSNKDVDWRGCVPLHFATSFNRAKIVELLLLRGADLRKRDRKGFYPIHTACQQNYDRFRELLETIVINRIDWIQNRNEQIEMIKLLAEKGADLNVFDNYGNAPLFYIYDFKYMLHEQWYLLDNMLDNVFDMSFLVEMYARRIRILEEIFKLGVPINIDRCYNRDSSILHYICQKNEFHDKEKLEMMEYFLEKNANVNAQRTDGMTPLHNLSFNCFDETLEEQEMARTLLKYNARVNLCNLEGKTPLFMACRRNNISLTERLLYHGADLNVEDHHGQTPFCYYFQLYSGTEPSQESLKFISTILIYICKLKSIGMYVSDKVLKSVVKLRRLSQSNRNSVLNDVQRVTMRKQIKILKNIEINGAISVYDVLSMNEHYVSRNIVIEHLYKTLYSGALRSHSDFGFLRIIYHKYKLAVVRRRLLPKAKQTLNRVFSTTRFPEVCSEFILAWLNNEELADFVEAFAHLTDLHVKRDNKKIKAFLKIRRIIAKYVDAPGDENELKLDLVTDLILKSG